MFLKNDFTIFGYLFHHKKQELFIDQIILNLSSWCRWPTPCLFWEKIIFHHLYFTFNLYKLKYKYIPWSHKNHVFRTLCAHSKSEKWKKCGGDQKGYSKHEPINFTKKTSHFTITTYYYLHSTAKFFFFLKMLFYLLFCYIFHGNTIQSAFVQLATIQKNLCFHQVFGFCLFESIF